MGELLSQAFEAVMYKRLLVLRIFLHSVATLCIAWTACTQNISVESLGFWERISLAAAIVALWSDKMIGFFDQTMSRLAKGQPPIGSGDTAPPFPPNTVKEIK